MSVAVISYRSLGKAIGEAKDVAKKFDKYQDSLYDNVYKKLNNYGGPDSSSLCSARGQAHEKIEELKDLRDRHYRLETDLKDMKDACKRVDTAVKSKVSSLTSTFRENHGIRNSKIENAVNYLGTKFANNTKLGRWLNKKNDELRSNVDYHKDCIKTWYNYQGGKELLHGRLLAALEIVIGVLSVAGAIMSGGGILVMVAGILLGVIATANGVANWINEGKAYEANQAGDPARAQRRSKINTWQDYLRSSFIFGDSGENYSYVQSYHTLAFAMDVTQTVCTVITFVSAASELLKNGYKWVTGSNAELSKISWKEVFSKKTFSAIKGQFTELRMSLKQKGWTAVKDIGSQMIRQIGDTFSGNLEKNLWNFTDQKGLPSVKSTIKTVKNLLCIPRDLLRGDSILKTGCMNVVLPSLTAFTVNSTEGTLVVEDSGQLKFDFTENITFGDFGDLFEKGGKIKKGFSNILDQRDGQKIELDVLKKINKPSSFNIAPYRNWLPNIELPVLRVA